MSSPTSDRPIYISSVALEVREQFGMPVSQVTFKAKPRDFKKTIPGEFPPGHTHHEVFNPALELPARGQLSALVRYRWWWSIQRTARITMEHDEIIKRAQEGAEGKKSYVTVCKNIVATVAFAHDVDANVDSVPPSPGESSAPVPAPPRHTESPSHVSAAPTRATPDEGAGGVTTAPTPEVSSDGSPAPSPSEDHGVDLPPSSPNQTPADIDGPLTPVATSEESHVNVPLLSTVMSPTISGVLDVCPRFRLLIVGNSGVGKSTLIRSVFGVKDVDVSSASRGQAKIDQEHVAGENERFVVHDSLGLEAAEGDHFRIVKEFIAGRRRQKELKDRLHAVWVCVQVPYAGGRVLEAGMEEFLRNRKTILGDIPVVVVVTKLDLLDRSMIPVLLKEGKKFKSVEEAKPFLEPRRSAFLEEHCGRVLGAVGRDIPYIAVSTEKGYRLEPTIPELVRKTTSEIERYIRADPSFASGTGHPTMEQKAQVIVAEMAQRASIEKKVDLTIEIGKKGYWPNLNLTIGFSDEKLEEHLWGVHREIVEVWNFHDPEHVLQDKAFVQALMETSGLGVDIPQANPDKPSNPFAAVMQLLLNDPTAIIVTLPFTAATLFYRAQKANKVIVKCFVAYIVDLINIMKILFILAPQGSVTSHNVSHALDVYKKSLFKDGVHLELKEFSAGVGMVPGGRSAIADKIETLVRRYNVTDEQLSLWRSQLQTTAGRS